MKHIHNILLHMLSIPDVIKMQMISPHNCVSKLCSTVFSGYICNMQTQYCIVMMCLNADTLLYYRMWVKHAHSTVLLWCGCNVQTQYCIFRMWVQPINTVLYCHDVGAACRHSTVLSGYVPINTLAFCNLPFLYTIIVGHLSYFILSWKVKQW